MGGQIQGIVERSLTGVIQSRLRDEPVLVLTGPRAVGKSTLLRGVGEHLDREVLDLDDPATRAAVAADPGFFAGGASPVLIDEFQKVPELLDVIKAELNRSLSPGRYVLAGSTRYETLPRAAQSLTGRAHVIPVWPLSQGEIAGRRETFVDSVLEDPRLTIGDGASGVERHEYVARVVAGGYPLALARSGTPRERWFADYVNLVIERDVMELSRVRQRDHLPRLLQRLVGQTGQLLNIAEAARATGLEASTAEGYAALLEAVFLLYRLPAWGATLTSRAGSTPKIHAVDSGLAAHLLRLTVDKLGRRTAAALTEFGHLLESFVVGEILRQLSWHDGVVTAGHWRTRDNAEVDLVLERSDGGVVGIEVKAGPRVGEDTIRSLVALADRLGDSWLGGIVLNTGKLAYTYDNARRLVVAPVDRLWSPGGQGISG